MIFLLFHDHHLFFHHQNFHLFHLGIHLCLCLSIGLAPDFDLLGPYRISG